MWKIPAPKEANSIQSSQTTFLVHSTSSRDPRKVLYQRMEKFSVTRLASIGAVKLVWFTQPGSSRWVVDDIPSATAPLSVPVD